MSKFVERFVSIRKRKDYMKLKEAIVDALQEYWDSMEKGVIWSRKIDACEKITLKSYRLLKYIRKERNGLNHCVDDSTIGETCDAAVAFYCLQDPKASYQEETEILEVLSRAAYREMKQLKKTLDEEEAEINR